MRKKRIAKNKRKRKIILGSSLGAGVLLASGGIIYGLHRRKQYNADLTTANKIINDPKMVKKFGKNRKVESVRRNKGGLEINLA